MRNSFVRRRFLRLLSDRVTAYAPENFGKSAIVFAPHPDDETLGCGGLTLKKKAAGANVQVVFMTDGRTSHGHLMGENELATLRRQEALAACANLGVAGDRVTYLAFADGALAFHKEEAIQRVRVILQSFQPQEIFLPYQNDQQVDHLATNEIVRKALPAYTGPTPAIYEYPIWAWHHWPWVSLYVGLQRATLSILKRSLQLCFGVQMLRDFQLGVPIGDVIDKKRNALAQHRTQMTQYLPDCGWITLHDIANGEWLDCFFQPYEFLRPIELYERHA